MATFPSAVVSLTDPTSTSKLNSPSHADQHINANAEIEAIETELGVNPAGAYTTVVARQNAELGCLHFSMIGTGAVTQYFVAPYNCTLSGYVCLGVSAGTGRIVTIGHGSAGANALTIAATVSSGTPGVKVAFTTSLATVAAAEIMRVTCTAENTAQAHGVTVIMTNPT